MVWPFWPIASGQIGRIGVGGIGRVTISIVSIMGCIGEITEPVIVDAIPLRAIDLTAVIVARDDEVEVFQVG